MTVTKRNRLIVIGASSGGIAALNRILDQFPQDLAVPVVAVLHIQETTKNDLAEIFRKPGRIRVEEAAEKGRLESGVLYLAPPGYHLLVESDATFSLSYEDKVNYSRPSVDVLFESAASAFGSAVIGVVLTGANTDGALGLKAIKEAGGIAVAEDPETAECPSMPEAAVKEARPDHVVPLAAVAPLLVALTQAKPVAERKIYDVRV